MSSFFCEGSFLNIISGVSTEVLASRLGDSFIDQVAGEDVVALLEKLHSAGQLSSARTKLCSRLLRERYAEYFLNKKQLKKIFSVLTENELDELQSRLGFTDRTQLLSFTVEEYPNCFEKFLGFFGIQASQLAKITSLKPCEPVVPAYGLFLHQDVAAKKVEKFLADPYSRVVLHMPTGAGKTRTAMHVVCNFLKKEKEVTVVWLAANAELLEQAEDSFRQAWSSLGNRTLNVYRCWGDFNLNFDEVGDGIVIAGLQKLNAFSKDGFAQLARLAGRTMLVVVDEAHQAVAPTYADIINLLSTGGSKSSLLGLTATPGRTWNNIEEDQNLARFFKGNKVILNVEGWSSPVTYLIDNGYLARPEFRRLNFTDPVLEKSRQLKDEDYSTEQLSRLAQQVVRNEVILQEVRKLVAEGHRRIILFSASVRHAEVLSAALITCGLDSRVVTGSTPKEMRSKTIKAFKSGIPAPMVLCNYGVLTTGFDAPQTSAAVIARPTTSLVLYSQMVGRATRGKRAGGNLTCVISTVVDIDLPGFGDVVSAFENWEDVWHD